MRRALTAALVTAVCGVASGEATAHKATHFWYRPYAELTLLKSQIRGLPPILDARCRGVGKPHMTPRGVRKYGHFGCRVLTNVGGPAPWVAVYIHATGRASFKAHVA